jgi:hypothetical protein
MNDTSKTFATINKANGSELAQSNPEYWFGLIDETPAADFLNLSTRQMQGYRYKGGGPIYIRLSPRCIRYRRIDLREWSEGMFRSSTSDQGGLI